MTELFNFEAITSILPSLTTAEQVALAVAINNLAHSHVELSTSESEQLYDLAQRFQHLLPQQITVPIDRALLGVVGRVASGKGTVGRLLETHYHFTHHVLSDRLREVGLLYGQRPPYERGFLRKINDIYKPIFGKQIFVAWTLTFIRTFSDTVRHSLDGFRSVEEATYFLSQGGSLIGVHADQQIRYKRLLERNRANDSVTWEDFQETERIEGVWIDPIFPLTSKTINNNGNLTDMEHQMATIVPQFLEERRTT